MQYQVRYEPKAVKQQNKIPHKDVLRIQEAVSRLQYNPFIGKKLKGELSSQYSLRVWPYRIIYEVFTSYLVVIVLRIAHRQGVYKN